MTSETSTSRVRTLCLGMGLVSLVLFLAAIAMAWLASGIAVQPAAQSPEPDFVGRVQATQSCEALKSLCADLALGYDAQHATAARLNRLTDELLKRIAWLAAGWAIATAAAFFYIFRAVRLPRPETAPPPGEAQ